MQDSTEPTDRAKSRTKPRSLVLGLWITALALTLLYASEVQSFVVHHRTLGAEPLFVSLTNTLVQSSEGSGAAKLSDGARDLVDRARPDTIWLRAEDDERAERATLDRATGLRTTGAAVELGGGDKTAGLGGAAAGVSGSAAGAAPSGAGTRAPLIAPSGDATRILIMGASSIQLFFGVEFEQALKSSYRGVKVKRLGKLSTGLVRNDYFDWPQKTRELLADFRPNVVIVQFGGNDAQSIAVPRGEPLLFGTPAWNEEFGRRMTALIELVKSKGARMIVLGMPVMSDPKFSKRMEHINGIMQESARSTGSTYISMWSLSLDAAGNDTNYVTLDGAKYLLRSTDGVHFTREGAMFMARKVGEQLEPELSLVPARDDRAVAVRREIASKALGRSVSYLAFVPQNTARGEGGSLPALLLFHGSKRGFADWAGHSHRNLQDLSTRHGLILVTPDVAAREGSSPIPESARQALASEIVADARASLPVSPSAIGVSHTFEEHDASDVPAATKKLPQHVARHAERLRAAAVTSAPK